MVEHAAHNRGVAGSIPATATPSHLQPLPLRVAQSGLLPDAGPVLVACSGGPDSTALLLALLELGGEVVAAHFNHDLRPGAAAEADHVARLCRRLGVRLIGGRRSDPLPRGSVQAGARTLRYAFLEAARDEVSAEAIAVAHTADDVVEGAVLHLLRGSGLAGLRGMPSRRGFVVRPLLDTWRWEVEAFLGRAGLQPLRDPSNLDIAYARVRARTLLLPQLEQDSPGFCRRLHAVARRAERLQAEVEAAATPLVENAGARSTALRSAAEPVRMEAFRQMYAAAGGSLPALNRRQLTTMDRLLQSAQPGKQLDLPEGLRFHTAYSRVEIGKTALMPSPIAASQRLQVSACPGCDAPGAIHLRSGLKLSLGRRRPGLRMRPLGGRGSRKLQDILVDAKVPRAQRDSLPLVFAGEQLAWVPGIAVDSEFSARPGFPALHVSLIAPNQAEKSAKSPMVDSTNHLQGVTPL